MRLRRRQRKGRSDDEFHATNVRSKYLYFSLRTSIVSLRLYTIEWILERKSSDLSATHHHHSIALPLLYSLLLPPPYPSHHLIKNEKDVQNPQTALPHRMPPSPPHPSIPHPLTRLHPTLPTLSLFLPLQFHHHSTDYRPNRNTQTPNHLHLYRTSV